MTKAQLMYLAVIACLALAFLMAFCVPLTMSDGNQ